MINIWPWSRIKKLNSDLLFKNDHYKSLLAYNALLEGWHEKEKAKVAAGLRIIADRNQTIADLKTDISSLNESLRIADERADKKASACDAAHDSQDECVRYPNVPSILAAAIPMQATPADVSRTAKRLRTVKGQGGATLVIKSTADDGAEAAPVWMDINQTRTLQYRGGRAEKDEQHISPLQLDVINRCIDMWSNPSDSVLTPFLGIGSEVYCAVEMGRMGIGIELKPSYFAQAVKNIEGLKSKTADIL